MNARLYDPVLGRMLSPDNYIQAAELTQNYNRYSYALNNPLKFTDPDGNFIFLPILIGAAIGGTVNLGIKLYQQGGKINLQDAAVAFGIGAVAGGAAVFVPQAIGVLGGYGLTTASGAVAAGHTNHHRHDCH